MKHSVRHMKVKRLTTPTFIKDAYDVKQTNSKVKNFFSKFLFNLLTKWGYLRQHYDDVTTEVWDFTPSKQEKLADKVMEALREMDRYGYSYPEPKDYAIIMGEHTFFEVIKDSDYSTGPFFVKPVAFSVGTVYYQDPYYGRMAFNWNVHVVPGLEGFAFIPKAIIERKM